MRSKSSPPPTAPWSRKQQPETYGQLVKANALGS
jgi:hypothetical protein